MRCGAGPEDERVMSIGDDRTPPGAHARRGSAYQYVSAMLPGKA
jgi:hypothetical protein